MTKLEEKAIAVIQNDVKWIKDKIDDYCKRTTSLERLVYIGMGILLCGEFLLMYYK